METIEPIKTGQKQVPIALYPPVPGFMKKGDGHVTTKVPYITVGCTSQRKK